MTTSSSLLRAVHHLRDHVGDAISDVELLRRYARDQDEDAFAALVRRHGRLVFSVARRQLKDVHHVEDVFQATFLALARSSGQLNDERSLTNWLYTVAIRQARKAKHREARRAEHEQTRVAPVSGSTDPLEVISGRELVSLIDEEFERLPENYRLVLLLCCVQGLSREEAADRLGWSIGAVKGRLERGRRRLADQLAKKGIAPSALFFKPFGGTVPEPLMSRAITMATSPWARSIPASIVDLLRLPSASKLLPVVVLCGALLAIGLTILLLQPVSHESAPGSPRKGEPLPERAIRRFGTARYRHGEPIVGLAVSRDDRLAVAFGRRQGSSHRIPAAAIYDLRDGRRLAKIPGRADSIEGVAISPDGKTVATKRRGAIHLHNAGTGAEIDKIPLDWANPRMINYWLVFSPDGSKIAQSNAGKKIEIVDRNTKKILHRVVHTRTVYAGAFSPDGKLLAAGDYDFVRLWDVATGKQVRRINAVRGHLASLAFSPDGKTLAGGGERMCLWDVATGKVQHLFEKNGDYIRSVAFSRDGRTVASAGDAIRLYDVATKKEQLRIPRPAMGLHFSAASDVLTAGVNGAIHRWNTKTGKLLTPTGCDSGIDQIDLTNNGRTLVTRDQAGFVQLWNRATGKHLQRLKMDDRQDLAVDPDGRYLVLSESDPSIKFQDPIQNLGIITGSRLKMFDLEKFQYVKRLGGLKGYSHDKELTLDGKTLVTVDRRNGKVRLWDIVTGKERRSCFVLRKDELSKVYGITGCVLSPDGKTLAVAYRSFRNPNGASGVVTLRLWDITTGKEIVQLNGHPGNIHGLAFSPDGRFLASCTQSPAGARRKMDAFFVWDVKAQQQLIRFSGEAASAYSVTFSPDGRTMATASLAGTVRVWEVASWTLRTKFQAHRDPITALHIAPDGTLFTGSFDATAMAWNIRPGRTGVGTPLAIAWTGLLDLQSGRASAAQGRLLATPKETVAFLAEHLHPVARVDPTRIAKLLADLDSRRFATREAASRALHKLGRRIEPTLRRTLAKTASKEVRRRLELLLSRLKPARATPTELRTLRAVEVLEWLATPSARELLSNLAKGEPAARLTQTSASAVKRLRARGK